MNMKTTYRRDNTETRTRLAVLIGSIFLGVVVLVYPPLRSWISSLFFSGSPAIWSVGNVAEDTSKSFFSQLKDNRVLLGENRKLKEDILRMQTQVLDRNLLAEKVAQLEESLGRERMDNRVPANVLVNSSRISYDVFVVDAGSSQGIKQGDLVAYSGAGIIGKVFEVYEFSSKIKLYSSAKEETPVLVGKEKIPAIARGKGMGNYEVILPQESAVGVGDTVLLPGTMLILGEVVFVEDALNQPFSKILFRLPFNTALMTTVEIIAGEKTL